MGYFWVQCGVQILFWGPLMQLNNFYFFMFPSILSFDFDSILGSFWTFLGPTGLFLGLGQGSKTVLRSTQNLKKLSFSMLPSIVTFDFDFILGSFWTFLGPTGLFLGSGQGPKMFLGFVHIDKQFFFYFLGLYQSQLRLRLAKLSPSLFQFSTLVNKLLNF